MRKIFTLLLLLIPLWVQAQDYKGWDETTKILTVTLGESGYKEYKNQAEHLVIKAGTSTEIPNSAFNGWSKLQSIIMEEGVTSIGEWAFYGCSSLTSITIPDNVTSIGSSAFQNCSSLASITIPGRVTSIGAYAFSGCTSLASITIPDNVTNIGAYAFSGCTSLASITIPGSVTSIGSSAFNGCTSLASITIPGSVTSIGSSAFKSCTSLTSITIPSSVTKIDNYVFQYCTSLASITIPDNVTSIGYYAFNGCSALTSIIYEGTKQLLIGTNAFTGISTEATVTVPAGYEGDSFGPFTGTRLKGKHYTITIPEQTGGTVKATVNGSEVTSAEGGATVTLIATPDDEYILGTLTVTDAQGNPVSVNDNTFTMPAANVTVTATFTAIEKPKPEEPEEPETPVIPDMPKYYNIMVEECEGVTVETSTNVVREGQSMTFTVDIAEGYTAEDMTVKVKRSLFGTTDIIEPNDEGIYEIKNIYTDIYITVDGVEEEEEETPTGMEDIEGAKAYAKDGSIYVETPQRVTVSIVSMTGAVVEQAEQIGQKRYDLPRGIYIICIDERRYKVRN